MKTNKKEVLKSFMDIDNKGFSHGPHTLIDGTEDWHAMCDINSMLIMAGFTQSSGNGSDMFQNDRGLGTEYTIDKRYSDSPRRLEYVRLLGTSTPKKTASIPKIARDTYSRCNCAHCGTGSNIQIDHKDGRKHHGGKNTIDDFQPLCQHCNLVKREHCKECTKVSKRFDARLLGYRTGWILGGRSYTSAGCIGCYWYDAQAFKQRANFK